MVAFTSTEAAGNAASRPQRAETRPNRDPHTPLQREAKPERFDLDQVAAVRKLIIIKAALKEIGIAEPASSA
ncbi:hypothetical protein CPT32_05985 [Rhizobium sophoriradicis]|nr:hypothetical protein CPT32_05985 [Rhizobium sophoriradicis]